MITQRSHPCIDLPLQRLKKEKPSMPLWHDLPKQIKGSNFQQSPIQKENRPLNMDYFLNKLTNAHARNISSVKHHKPISSLCQQEDIKFMSPICQRKEVGRPKTKYEQILERVYGKTPVVRALSSDRKKGGTSQRKPIVSHQASPKMQRQLLRIG